MKKLGVYFFILLSLVTVLLPLLGYLGKSHLYLELLVNFKLQYFLLSLIPPIFFVITRRFTWFIVSFLCLLLNFAPIAPWYLPSALSDRVQSDRPVTRLFLFNVLHQNTQYSKAISLVKSEQPTIAVFLEATVPWPQELTALQADFPYHYTAKRIQIEIYSKVELQNPVIHLYGTYRGFVSSQVKLDDREVLFVAAHTYSPVSIGKQGFLWRNQQLEDMGNYLQATDKPVVVVGDLNITMWSRYYQKMIQLSGLHNTRAGFGILPTQSIISPQIPWLSIPIDHSLVSKGVKVKDVRTGAYIGSDHLPLITDVVFDD